MHRNVPVNVIYTCICFAAKEKEEESGEFHPKSKTRWYPDKDPSSSVSNSIW
jgi:hypothetical protein